MPNAVTDAENGQSAILMGEGLVTRIRSSRLRRKRDAEVGSWNQAVRLQLFHCTEVCKIIWIRVCWSVCPCRINNS